MKADKSKAKQNTHCRKIKMFNLKIQKSCQKEVLQSE